MVILLPTLSNYIQNTWFYFYVASADGTDITDINADLGENYCDYFQDTLSRTFRKSQIIL